MGTTTVIATFYKFVALPDFAALREVFHEGCVRLHIRGTLLLAAEGINGTLAGAPEDLTAALHMLRSDPRLADLEHKESYAPGIPFRRLKVRCRREIVSLGRPEADPTRQVGVYVEPRAWNELIQDPDLLLIDTRNDYEYAVGSFAGAIDPGTGSFREFPDYVNRALGDARGRKIATFCTGGIRCEKATAFLLAQGFEQVYHLKGGILKYLEEIPPQESLWRGECFVFDERVSLEQGLRPGRTSLCPHCGWAVREQRACTHCRSQFGTPA